MSQQVTISSVTANTPVDIYYCNSTSGSCVYVATVATFPFVFDVPPPYDEQNFLIKIVDTQGCIDGIFINVTPTPTPSITASPTKTQTSTPTPTNTSSNTPSQTTTITPTPSITPSFSPTPTKTPIIAPHDIGNISSNDIRCICESLLTVRKLYTYISDAYITPVIGVTVYSVENNSVLYVPYVGGNNWILMKWINGTYAVKIDNDGKIVDFTLCQTFPTPTTTPTATQTKTPGATATSTPTQTPTQTQTPTPSVTVGLTPTATETPTQTQTQTPSQTATQTQTPTPSVTINLTPTATETPTQTQTQTPSQTATQTQTQTPTNTETPTQTQTPTQTPTPTKSCLCYYFENQDITGSVISYYDCGGNNVIESLGIGARVERCIQTSPAPDFTGGVTAILPCTSTTICTDNTDCTGCTN